MNNLRAALTLVLEDKLSGSLNKLRDGFSRLKDVGRQITLGKLDNAADKLDSTTRAAGRLESTLRRVRNTASRAGAAVSQMWQKHFGEQSRAGAFAAAAEGYSVAAPIRAYASYENVLRHIAITRGLHGPAIEAEVARLNTMFGRDALASGQSSESIADAFRDLLQAGLKFDVAEKLIGIHSRAATAYGISPEELGHAVFALSNSYGIDEKQMPLALSAMAQASKEGLFKVADFSRYLPMIGGQMALMGMTGIKGVATAFAALETVTQNSADPAQAATNFYDALRYITSPAAARAFAMKGKMVPTEIREMMKQSIGSLGAVGIDLPKLLIDAEKRGINPLDEVVAKLALLTKGKSFVQSAELLGALLHNQQAGVAIASLIAHRQQFLEKRDRYMATTPELAQQDFASAFRAPQVQVQLFSEMLVELERRIGQGFAPVLYLVNLALDTLITLFKQLDAISPSIASGFLLIVGGTLAFGAALAALGVVGPPIKAGWDLWVPVLKKLWVGLRLIAGLLTSTVGLVVLLATVLIAAAVDIYEHWDRFSQFFSQMWEGLQDIVGGFVDFISGVFHGDMHAAVHGLMRMWSGFLTFFGGYWDAIKRLFLDFTDWVDGWTGGAVTKVIGGIKSAWGSLAGWFSDLWKRITQPFENFLKRVQESPVGGFLSRLAASAADNPEATGGVALGRAANQTPMLNGGAAHSHVHMSLWTAPGTGAEVTRADPGVTVQHINPGQVLGRP